MHIEYLKKYLLIILLFWISNPVYSKSFQQQDSLLETRVTLHLYQLSLKAVIQKISYEFHIPFAYSESLIALDEKVSVNAEQVPLHKVLDELFKYSRISYKEVQGQIILYADRRKTKQDLITISGFVRDSASRELLANAYISVSKDNPVAVCNGYGYYSLSLPEGYYQLKYAYVGYEVLSKKIYLRKDTTINVGLSNMELEEFVVEDKSKSHPSNPNLGAVNIDPEKVENVTALIGEKDVLKVVQLMPGVQKASEGQSGLYVRGGGADQNLIILDDATVYNAFHLFGFYSIFNGNALKNITFMKGGFSAKYGGRVSSVMDIQMKDGNKQKHQTEIGIGLLSANVIQEGPLKKNKSSYIISARRTYLDLISGPFMPKNLSAGYYFYDVNAKINYDINQNNKIYISGYFGQDRFYMIEKSDAENDTKSTLDWGNNTFTGRWNHIYNRKLFSNTSIVLSNYKFHISASEEQNTQSYNLLFTSGIRDYSLKHDIDYFLSPKHTIRTGAQLTYHIFTPTSLVVRNDFSKQYETNKNLINAFESAIYVEDEWKINERMKTISGFRFSTFTNRNKTYFNPEPRVNFAYNLNEKITLKASYAKMYQYVQLISNTGTGLPTDLWVPSTNNLSPQRSHQVSLGGVKNMPKKNLVFSVETFFKKSFNVLGYVEGASFLAVDDNTSIQNYNWEKILTSGRSWSYGSEFLLQKKAGNWTGWLGYTLSWSQQQFEELNNGKKFWARYDRRHDVSFVNSYKINRKVSLNMTWVYATGNAITLPVATYSSVQHLPDRLGFYNTKNVSEYTERNSFRMKPYHRLDISLRNTKNKRWGTRIYEVGIYNVYNRANPYFYFIGQNSENKNVLKQLSLFPVLPYVSWTFRF